MYRIWVADIDLPGPPRGSEATGLHLGRTRQHWGNAFYRQPPLSPSPQLQRLSLALFSLSFLQLFFSKQVTACDTGRPALLLWAPEECPGTDCPQRVAVMPQRHGTAAARAATVSSSEVYMERSTCVLLPQSNSSPHTPSTEESCRLRTCVRISRMFSGLEPRPSFLSRIL